MTDLQELADAGGNLIRTGIADWRLNWIDQQILAERTKLDAAAAHRDACSILQ
jgi:hypothetical protein